MDMLDLGDPTRDSSRHEELVDFLRMLFVDVGIPLNGVNVCDIVDIIERVAKRVEQGARLHELVHISTNNDARVGVEGKDRVDKILH